MITTMVWKPVRLVTLYPQSGSGEACVSQQQDSHGILQGWTHCIHSQEGRDEPLLLFSCSSPLKYCRIPAREWHHPQCVSLGASVKTIKTTPHRPAQVTLESSKWQLVPTIMHAE